MSVNTNGLLRNTLRWKLGSVFGIMKIRFIK